MNTPMHGRWRRAGAAAARWVERVMLAEVAVGRPDAPAETGWTVADAVLARVVYRGRARVPTVGSAGSGQVGDKLTFFSSSSVTLPLNGPGAEFVQVDDTVEVLDYPDPDVVGRCFRVTNVDSGGYLPYGRRLSVVSVQRHPNWTWDWGTAPDGSAAAG